MLKYSVQIRNPAAGSGPTLTCSPYPRVASLSKTFFFCGEAGVWHQTRRPAASHWSLPTPSRVSSSSVVVELMWCSDSNALRAPHMTLYIRKRTSKYFCSMLFSSFLFFSFPLFFKCASKWELSASCLEPLCFSGGWWGFNADNHSPIQQRTPYGTINLKAGGPQSTDSQLNSTSFGLE